MHNIKSLIFLKKFLTGFWKKKGLKNKKTCQCLNPLVFPLKNCVFVGASVFLSACLSNLMPEYLSIYVNVYLPICLDLLAISLVEQWSLHMGSAGQICILLKNWSNSFMGKENPKKVALSSFAAHLRSTDSNPFKAWIFSPLFCNCNAAHLLRS